jgi:hypothetical protein
VVFPVDSGPNKTILWITAVANGVQGFGSGKLATREQEHLPSYSRSYWFITRLTRKTMKKSTILAALTLLGWLTACAPTASTTGGAGTNAGNGNTTTAASGSGTANAGMAAGRAVDEANTADPAAGSGNVTDGKFGNQPPEEVTSSFKQRYPSYTSGDWTMEDGHYSTTYMKEGKSYRASFSNTGEWLDTRNDVVLDDLPAPVKQAFQGSAYGSATNARFSQLETAQYPVLYRAEGQLNNQPFSLYLTPEGGTVDLPH